MADLPPSMASSQDLPPSVAGGGGPPSLSDGPPSMQTGSRFRRFGTLLKAAREATFAPSVLGSGKAYELAKIPSEKARELLTKGAEMIPEGTTNSPTMSVIRGTPRVAAEVAAEFVPSLMHPSTLALQAAGPAVVGLAKTPIAQRAAGAIAAKIPTVAKRAFTYRFGQPSAYVEAAERRGINVSNASEEAVQVGRALKDNLTNAQQLRTNQILRGGVSVSEKELPLRLRSSYARSYLDPLEQEAKSLNLIPDSALNRYTRKQLAELRKTKQALDSRIDAIKNFGQPAKEKLLGQADKLKIAGATGLVRKVEGAEDSLNKLRTMIDDAKESLTAEEFHQIENLLSNQTIRRNAGMQRLLQRFEKASIGQKERMFTRLASFAEKTGIKVGKIYDSELSIGNFKGLVNKINSLSSRFPGKSKLVRELEAKSQGIQDKIVSYYTNSGQKYAPRLYMQKELAKDVPATFPGRAVKILGDRFKGRAVLSDEVRAGMGEIKQPSFPVAKGISEVTQSVETEKLFKKVATNPQWSSPGPIGDFVKLPQAKSMGSLSGKYVHPEIARDIQEITHIPSNAAKAYNWALSKWKFGKVVANPATHFRNMFSNSVLADIGGMGHEVQAVMLPKAAQEVLKRGPAFNEARQAGLFKGGFYGNEIKTFRDALLEAPKESMLTKVMNASGKMADKAGRAYEAEEHVFKMAKFMHNRQKGMSVKEAVDDAEKWLFNYEKVSPAVKAIKNAPLGSPFITFSSKAIPRIAEAALKNPISVYKYKVMIDSVNKVAQERLNLSDDDVAVIKRNTRGQFMILPSKGADGKPEVLDLSYLLPWGDIGETGGGYFLGQPAPSVLSPSGPLRSGVEAFMNKSSFKAQNGNTGEIFNPEIDTASERAAKTTDFLGKSLLPSLTPGIPTRKSPFKGGYGFNKLQAAVQKKPDYFGRVKSVPKAVADTLFGLKTTPVDVPMLKVFELIRQQRNMEDLQRVTSSMMRSQAISKEEKKEIMKEFTEKAKRLTKRK
jgi:hypothetical protein